MLTKQPKQCQNISVINSACGVGQMLILVTNIMHVVACHYQSFLVLFSLLQDT